MSRSLRTTSLALASGLLIALAANTAEAAPRRSSGARQISGGQGKFLRFHADTYMFGFQHVNPDGNADNFNSGGFGIGRANDIDGNISFNGAPIWSLGFGAVLFKSQIIVGGKVGFAINSGKNDDSNANDNDTRFTYVGGDLVPYFQWVFRPGKRIRPYAELRFGFGGYTRIQKDEVTSIRTIDNVIYPIVGPGGGVYVFINQWFSFDGGLNLDYYAPHARQNIRGGNNEVTNDYSKAADAINLGFVAGFSAWF